MVYVISSTCSNNKSLIISERIARFSFKETTMEKIYLNKICQSYRTGSELDNYSFEKDQEYEFIISEDTEVDVGYELLKYAKEKGFKVKTLSYQGAEYIGKESNPYFCLATVNPDTTTLKVHPDTRFISRRAAYRHKNVRDVEFSSSNLHIDHEAFYSAGDLRKVFFKNAEHISFGVEVFQYTAIRIVDFDPNASYEFAERTFANCPYLMCRIPENIDNNGRYTFEESGKLLFVPAKYNDISMFYFKEDVEVYHEGNNTELKITPKRYIRSEGDYGFNFHRSAGSFDYDVSEEPAKYCSNGKSNQTYEDFLKRRDELMKTSMALSEFKNYLYPHGHKLIRNFRTTERWDDNSNCYINVEITYYYTGMYDDNWNDYLAAIEETKKMINYAIERANQYYETTCLHLENITEHNEYTTR